MPHEKLENLVRIRKLKTEAASRDEIAGLVRSGLARLTDSKNATLSQESRFDLAYNAAHALSLAALRAAGYRSENRYLVFQCTQHTLDLALLPRHSFRELFEGLGCSVLADRAVLPFVHANRIALLRKAGG